jgi:hypothetical protein
VTNTHGKGSISIQIVGTFSGTLTFEQSNDGGTTYVTLSVTPYKLLDGRDDHDRSGALDGEPRRR